MADRTDDVDANPGLPTVQSDVLHLMDEIVGCPADPSSTPNATHFPWMDDLLDHIEQEAAKSSDGGAGLSRSLAGLGEFLEPDRDAVASNGVAQALGDEDHASHRIKSLDVAKTARPASTGRHMWQAVAAVALLVGLGASPWRMDITRAAKSLFEHTKGNIVAMVTGEEPDSNESTSGISAASADPEVPRQADEIQPQPNAQVQNTTTDIKAETARAGNSGQQETAPANTLSPAQSQLPNRNQQAPSAREPIPGAQEMIKAAHSESASSKSAWLWKATARGNPDAPVQLADLYVRGDGVPRSCEQAVVLLKTAAVKDNAGACNRLASMYADGTCVQRNRVEAYRWLHAALVADPNNQWAQQNRDTIWHQMSPEERTLAQPYR